MPRLSIGAILLLATVSTGALGQDQPTDAACDAADQAVDHLALPSLSDSAWFRWYTLASCGQKGTRAAAAALRTSVVRHEAEAARVAEFFRVFGGMKSNLLLNAFQDAAEDNTADVSIRLWAIDAMTGYVSPDVTIGRTPLGFSAPTIACGSVPRPVLSPGSFDDLPNDTFGRVLNSVRRVANKASATPPVKALADCWTASLDLRAPVSTGQIQLSYVCAKKFKIHNGNTAVVNLRYSILQTTETGPLTVLPGDDLLFVVGSAGTVQLTYNGHVIGAKANTGTKCP